MQFVNVYIYFQFSLDFYIRVNRKEYSNYIVQDFRQGLGIGFYDFLKFVMYNLCY